MKMNDLISRQAAIDAAKDWYDGFLCGSFKRLKKRLEALPSAQPDHNANVGNMVNADVISRQAAIDALKEHVALYCDNTPDTFSKLSYAEKSRVDELDTAIATLVNLPSAQPERKWTSCSNPPKHHKDVIVRGIEAIGNVTVHKVMQWDVDTWRPTDYAPSVMWKEWSEI